MKNAKNPFAFEKTKQNKPQNTQQKNNQTTSWCDHSQESLTATLPMSQIFTAGTKAPSQWWLQ